MKWKRNSGVIYKMCSVNALNKWNHHPTLEPQWFNVPNYILNSSCCTLFIQTESSATCQTTIILLNYFYRVNYASHPMLFHHYCTQFNIISKWKFPWILYIWCRGEKKGRRDMGPWIILWKGRPIIQHIKHTSMSYGKFIKMYRNKCSKKNIAIL